MRIRAATARTDYRVHDATDAAGGEFFADLVSGDARGLTRYAAALASLDWGELFAGIGKRRYMYRYRLLGVTDYSRSNSTANRRR